MNRFVEFRTKIDNNSSLRNVVIPIESLVDHIDPTADCYRSLFVYPEEIKTYIEQNHGIAGYYGEIGADKLVWDFDNLNLEKAREDAVSFIKSLITKHGLQLDQISICFSGRKGFAIELLTEGFPLLEEFTKKIPLLVKKICLTLANGLESFDRVIYNNNRLFRIVNTLHQKPSKLGGIETNLFKVPLTFEQIEQATIEEIQRYATRPRLGYAIRPCSDSTSLQELVVDIYTKLDQVKIPDTFPATKPFSGTCPKNYKLCIWRLCQGEYTENRDNALLRIANYERQLGMPPEVIKAKLSGVLEIMNRTNPEKAAADPITEVDLERLIRQTFNNEYSFSCNDPLLSSICKEQCYLYRAKQNASKVGTVSLLDAYNKSSEFYRNYYSSLVRTGFPTIDDNMPMFLGNLNLLVGKPGVGKTSLCLNIIKNASKLETPMIFFNMDMSAEMSIAKLGSILLADIAQKPTISTKEFMEAHTKQIFNGDFKKTIEELSKWVWISSERHLSITDMMNELDMQERLMNRKFKLVIIDHVQLLQSDAKSEYEKHTRNAEQLTELAKNNNVCILGLSHAVTSEGGIGLEAKGSRSWSAECSTQVNCYRPMQHIKPEKDYFLTLQLAKNRLGITDSIDLFYDGASGWMRQLTSDEQLELIGLKEEVKERSSYVSRKRDN